MASTSWKWPNLGDAAQGVTSARSGTSRETPPHGGFLLKCAVKVSHFDLLMARDFRMLLILRLRSLGGKRVNARFAYPPH